jgi:hypothetical protein
MGQRLGEERTASVGPARAESPLPPTGDPRIRAEVGIVKSHADVMGNMQETVKGCDLNMACAVLAAMLADGQVLLVAGFTGYIEIDPDWDGILFNAA